ncbi:sensor histidine kinase [Pedobacter punctiformis]|uniref:Histidine kinase n=1 Tax=Pedobacter punctiformis TaxID=3004097 RepID=A0ABT4L6P0_9SPHI|nr:histidine kinase [Pedobacter sp. HCMS5-2]MCZ4243592.1 histidine kinase [Pedobacter sp. HCMS5-2]
MKQKISLFIIVLFISCFSVFAQTSKLNYNFTIYNSGLPSNTIYKILCDKDGKLWLGTNKGAVKYDGNVFKTFDTSNGMAANNIVNLFYQPKENIMWPLTYNSKLIKINTKSDGIINLKSKEKIVGAIMYGYKSNNSINFITAGQNISLQGKEIKANRLESNFFTDYLNTNQTPLPFFYKNLFNILSHADITKNFSLNKKRVFAKNSTRLGKYGTILLKNNIFIKQQNKIYQLLDINSFIKHPDCFIVDLEIVDYSLYLAISGTDGGLYYAKDFFKNPKNATFKLISEKGSSFSVCKDKVNNIWYTINGKGLNVITQPDLSPYVYSLLKLDNIEGYDQIRSINDSLVAINNLLESKFILLNTNKYDIEPQNQLSLNLAKTGFLRTFSNLAKKLEKDISHDAKVFFNNNSIEYYTDEKSKKILIDVPASAIRKGDYYHDKVIFSTADDSVYVLNKETKKIDLKRSLSPLGTINDIYFHNDSLIFFCTTKGIFTSAIPFKKIHKLSSKIVNKILVNDNLIYFLGDDGLSYSKYNTKDKIETIFSPAFFTKRFSIIDFDLTKHNILLLTDVGFMSLDKKIIDQKPTPIKVNLEKIILKDSTIYVNSNLIEIESGKSSQINFLVQFLNPENNSFVKEYSLSTTSDNWIPFKDNSFLQTNISPGKYILKIKAIRPGKNEEAIIKYEIIIKPSFWQTGLFLTLLIAFSVIIVVLITSLILKSQEKKTLKKIALEQHIAEIENRAFLNQLNPHFLFNALNTLQDYIIQKDTHNGIFYLQRLASLHRNILDFHLKPTITVSEEKNFLEKYLYIQQKRFSDKFSFTINSDREANQLKLPAMLVQPIIENVIDHGFANQDPDKEVNIEFKEKNGYLQIIITDNGNGCLEKILPLKEGHALYIIKERLYFINIKNNTHTNSIDFKANHPKGIKTTIYLDL